MHVRRGVHPLFLVSAISYPTPLVKRLTILHFASYNENHSSYLRTNC